MMATAEKVTDGKWIGRSMRRVEDPRLLTGGGTFVDDLKMGHLHHLAILRSPYPHARILRIDTSAAARLPGVRVVVTGPEVVAATQPFSLGVPAPLQYYCVADEKARFVGEPVAAVVATNRYVAEDALDLIRVDYEPLPATVDPERSMDRDAPVLHEQVGDNAALHRIVTYGDPEKAFREADLIISEKFRFPKYGSTPIETYAVIGQYDAGSGMLTIWSNFMGPFIMHPITARALQIPENKLRFIVPPDIGGSFGIKSSIYPYLALVGAAAMRAGGVPVKWIEDRREHLMASSSGTDRVAVRELALKKDGTITGVRAKIWENVGAYMRTPEPACTFRPIGNFLGGYHIRNLAIDAYNVTTNKSLTGPNRGYGCQQIYFELERAIDLAAEKLKMDPAEIRLKNLIPPDRMPYTSATGGIYDSGDYPKALRMALEIAGYEDLRRRQAKARAEGRLFGIGLATAVDPSVSNMGYVTVAIEAAARKKPEYLPKSGAGDNCTIRLDPFGKISVTMATTPQGQGHQTAVTQIVAEILGMDPNDITVTDEFDTATRTWSISSGTYSSRFASVATSAAAQAAQKLRARLCAIGAHLLEVTPERVELKGGRVTRKDNPEKQVSIGRIAGVAHWNPTQLPAGSPIGVEETAIFSFPKAQPPDEHDRVNSSNTYGFIAEVVAVEVDPDTADVKILKYVTVHDAGTVINPMVVEGQIYGGAAHGIGGALYEELAYNEEGQFLAATFMDYLVPSAPEVPVLDIDHVVSPSPITVLGSKGCGESSTMTAPAAIGNAVADALRPLGVTITELPLTPDRVFHLLRRAKSPPR
jgi:2-furoyl-CoA dehydrogenase large subunit